jgi:glycosyltransferase involved in cell wall biosynthesis
MMRVSYIFPTSHHYRLPFHERLREILAGYGIDYVVIYCDPNEENKRKRDTVDVSWGIKVRRTDILRGLVYQHGLVEALKSDLVIVQQENSLLINYILHLLSALGFIKLAYFGHGRNFQSRNPNSWSERLKRFLATKPNWWFGYTDETRRYLVRLGYPKDNITVFNNSVDTSEIKLLIDSTTQEMITSRRAISGVHSNNIGIFVGGLYEDKRLPFLVDAADIIRSSIPDFELVVVGGGLQLNLMQELSQSRPWIKVMGPQFGSTKIETMLLGKVFLMPGLVGLAIVDAGTAGLPMITTAFPWHSPEIAYLEHNVNGLKVDDWKSPAAYAQAVVDLLLDTPRLDLMRQAARERASTITIEAMAERFSIGVLKALGKT